MQLVLERGSIDNPLTFEVGLIQLSFIIHAIGGGGGAAGTARAVPALY